MVGEEVDSFCGQSPLWNVTLLLNSSWPSFTMCFQSSVLVYVPNGYLWFAMLFYLPYLIASPPGSPLPITISNSAKTILSVLLALFAAAAVVTDMEYSDEQNRSYPDAHYIARYCECATYLLSAVVSQHERKRGVINSGVLFVYWLLLAVIDVVPLYSYILMDFANRDFSRVFIFLISYAFIIIQLLLQGFVADRPVDYSPGMCPEQTATFLSRVTFCWMTKLITSGFRKPLEAGDLWSLNVRDHSAIVVPKLERALMKANVNSRGKQFRYQLNGAKCRERNGSCVYGQDGEEEDGRHPGTVVVESRDNNSDSHETVPLLAGSCYNVAYNSVDRQNNQQFRTGEELKNFSLLRVLVKTYCADVLQSYICKMMSDFLQYLMPLLLGLLLTHIEDPDDQPWKGYVIAVFMMMSSWSQTSFYHQHYHMAMTTGLRMKTALMAAIYKKSLVLSVEGQKAGSVGEIVNLMSVDCQNVQEAMSYTWMIWSIPLQVGIAVYLLWNTMGISVLAGLGLLVVLVPINGLLALKQQKYQKDNLGCKDRRLKVMNEIVDGIKILKLYAWETSFKEKVTALRGKEIGILKKIAHLNAFSIFIWTCAPYMVTLATFTTYVLLDDDARLDPNKAFVTLSLFNILQFPIAFVPEMISFTAKANVSIRRIEKFLKQGEHDPDVVLRTTIADKAVSIERGHFTWDVKGRSTLHGINVDVSEGELVAVVGPVGCGKSSLIASILGDMERRQGKVVVKGSIAYVPQQAWIQNATLKNNILFGKQFNAKWYRKVIKACALGRDLDMLPQGDNTEIGEKGINLSGGQKQRVSLARAVYADHDIYLFDDPLSAVDSHVGKHIFCKIISDKGILKHKTRLLVTHAVQWLPLVDTVVLMQEGRVIACGSYLQLLSHGGPLVQYLQAVLANTDEDNEDSEVLELKRQMMMQIESTSEGTTSGEDVGLHRDHIRLTNSGNILHEQPSPSSSESNLVSNPRLTEEEQTATGRVKMKVFGSYVRHMGIVWCIVILLMFTLYRGSSIAADFWLSTWTEDPLLNNYTLNISTSQVAHRNHYFLTFYGLLGVGQAVFISLYAWISAIRMTHAASNMHATVLSAVLRSPMSFFDTTPSGRIVNRFARDIDTIDSTLPQILFMFVMCVFSVASTLVVICVATPYFFSVILPLTIGYYALQRFFVPTSRQLKRLEAVTRSPIFSHFSETLSGVSVIRAYRATGRFVREALEKLDKNQVFYFAGISANRWLGVWIEVISSFVVFAATLFAMLTPGVTAGRAGLSITYALQITQALKWLVRTVSDLETNVVSVERLQEYSELKPEAPLVMPQRPKLAWPIHGNITFTNYSTRYRLGLDHVLKNININILGGEKVGIVGRTGAGKSSLTLALFRLIEPVTGAITIDGLDITSLGLNDLRSRLTILPQDPVLFSGSLRTNLDPFGQFSEQELWTALQFAHLLPFVQELPLGLEYDCGDGGRNLSVGQRQLVCLARGLLRKTRILVLDEPTAAVDPETDILIQGTIRHHFADCTTLTIAHRLNTIMDYDRVLVLDEGRVKEFDKPFILLQNKSSIFFSLALDAGLVIDNST